MVKQFNEKNKYKCKICGEEFRLAYSLIAHKHEHRKKEKLWKKERGWQE